MTERWERTFDPTPDGMPSAARGELSKRYSEPSKSQLIWGELKYIARIEKERFKRGTLEALVQAGRYFLDTKARSEPKKSR